MAGFVDELEKIGQVEPSPNRERAKKWLKNTAIVAGGAGAGAALSTIGDRLLTQKLGPTWAKMNPNTRRFILGPLIGGATAGSILAAHKLMEERRKADE